MTRGKIYYIGGIHYLLKTYMNSHFFDFGMTNCNKLANVLPLKEINLKKLKSSKLPQPSF